ncbi:MAG: urea transporter [Muribaculaceae bacterium]|nr:urea transporter [Muribaculaceae bacterium]
MEANGSLRLGCPVTYLHSCLRGAGQVMFQNSSWTGLLFLIGIFYGAYAEGQPLVAWGGAVALLVSTITGYVLEQPSDEGEEGLWGFNGILVGCGIMTFVGNTVGAWIAIVLCSALTVWVRRGFNNIMSPWGVSSFTFPFVFCTWIFLLCARTMSALPSEYMSAVSLPTAETAIVHPLDLPHLLVYWLKGVSQVFLINNWVSGVLFLIGLALCSRWAAFWAAAGSGMALFIAIAYGAPSSDIANGLYGFSPVLTAIALGCTFYKPSWRSALWCVLGTVTTVFIQGAMDVLFMPVGLPTLTAPFCIATWLFIFPKFKIGR